MRLPDLSGLRIAVIGDVMLDRYWWGETTRISPEAPVPVVRLDKLSDAVGGAANVAANIAGLGATPILVGVIGDDGEGSVITSFLAEIEHLDTRLVRSDARGTTVKTRIVSGGHHVVRVDRESTDELDLSESEELASAITEADLIVLSDYAKGVLSKATLEAIFALAAGKTIVVDPKSNDFSRYNGATILTPNAREAAAAAGVSNSTEAGSKILSDNHFNAVLVTEGEHGMTLFERDRQPVKYKAHARDAFDVTGAGDTVIATLSACIAAKMSLIEAVEIANIAAGVAVSHVGTTIVTRKMLISELAQVQNV